MNNSKTWSLYRNRYIISRIVNVVSRKVFKEEIKFSSTKKGKTEISLTEFTEWLIESINGEKSFMVSRYGSVEATLMFMGLGRRLGAIAEIPEKAKKELHTNAGFFPLNDNLIEQYIDVMLDASKEIDVLGYWGTGYQEYLVDMCCNDEMKIVDLEFFQPYQSKDDKVWTVALKGKKVLVIHPFAETIQSQYARREMIWENPNILPEFELRTVKAVQTIAGQEDFRFKTWFEALEHMTNEALKEDFDVAVVACGAYGMPLAANLKRAGKKVIHWGGISQIWFGIKGKRWDKNPNINKFYNDSWVRPSQTETPKAKSAVEGGCYW